MKTRVKICCISSTEEAQMVIDAGADAIGLVGQMPSGPGIIPDVLIEKIVNIVPSSIDTFLLTSETTADGILKQYKNKHTSTIQVVDRLHHTEFHAIKSKLPHVKLVQVIHVIDNESVKDAIQVSQYVDAILLDSGNPNLKIKELGGTGRTHNWKLSRKIRDAISIPLFLAGGLNAENIIEAIETVQPFGVDLCSGVRSNDKLDKNKLNAFFKAIKGL